MNYQIRKAKAEDITEIVKLCVEHAEYEKIPFNKNGKARRLDSALFSANPPCYCLIAENETDILGYATYTFDFSTWDADYYTHMDCLFLRPFARNLGIGKALIKYIAHEAIKRNCNTMQWHTPPFNERAIKFYHRVGAKSREKTRFYLHLETINDLIK
jgi:GNAT superfamily N-acetyltransferase